MFDMIFKIVFLLCMVVIAACCVVFPTIYLVQKKNQHDEIMKYLRNRH